MPDTTHRQPGAQVTEDDDTDATWRNLALQFDGHRMQAMGLIRYAISRLAKNGIYESLREKLIEFNAAPPLPGEAVLAERIAALAHPSTTSDTGGVDYVALEAVAARYGLHKGNFKAAFLEAIHHPSHFLPHSADPESVQGERASDDWQIWCDTCEGSGTVYQEHQAGCHVGGDHDCPDCDGKGYFVKRLKPVEQTAADVRAIHERMKTELSELYRYDAGLLSDHGGGDVEWWQDYIRAELDRAHDFYANQGRRNA